MYNHKKEPIVSKLEEFEPKTKAGEIVKKALVAADKAIADRTDEPGEKETAQLLIAGLEAIVKRTPSKIDDVIAIPMLKWFKIRYKV
jgi:hypothetical protein